MSTVPGPRTWTDAGLVPPHPDDEVVELDAPVDLRTETAEDDPEEYRPTVARGDRDGTAAEADVADQAAEVPLPDATAGDEA